MSNKLNIGDVVTLTCGGLRYTIVNITTNGEYACCSEKGERHIFTENEIVKVTYITPTVVTDDGKKAHFLCNWAEHNIDKFHTNMEWYTGVPVDPPEQNEYRTIWLGIYVFR